MEPLSSFTRQKSAWVRFPGPKETTMKTWFGLALIILPLGAGCAPGYYEKEPAYQAYEQSYPTFTRNPETNEEYLNRIWRESQDR